jgi:hypothetical protein
MSNDLITAMVSVVTALIGLAALSVVLSKNANTSGVIQAGAGGLSTDIGAAVAPISGGGLGSLTMPTIGTGNGL